MSSAVNVRAAALRVLGATVFAAFIAAAGAVGSVAAPVRTISVLVPIVTDAGDGQFLSADEVGAETAPDGDWTLLTAAAKRHGFTVALDSRIVASVAALGDDAPESAITWLDEVNSLNPLLLPWGNADVWALVSGESVSFSADEFGLLANVEPTELVVWPSGDVVDSSSVVTTASRGFTRMIVGDDQFAGGFDSAASGALADAVSPDSSTSALAGAAAVRAELSNGDVVVLPRTARELDAAMAVSVLDQVVGTDVRVARVIPTSVNSVRTPFTEVSAPASLGSVFESFAADEARAATITDEPAALLASRVRSLAVTTSDLDPIVFESAAEAFIADRDWLSRLVSISLATEYTVLSNTADVPVSVSNDSGAAVTVEVRVRSTSGIVQVETPSQSVTIEPRSNIRITVPMTAVTNGRTALVVSLMDPAGTVIGKPVSFPIEVQAQWEILTVVVFFGSVIVIMTIGILRTIRRRRAGA